MASAVTLSPPVVSAAVSTAPARVVAPPAPKPVASVTPVRTAVQAPAPTPRVSTVTPSQDQMVAQGNAYAQSSGDLMRQRYGDPTVGTSSAGSTGQQQMIAQGNAYAQTSGDIMRQQYGAPAIVTGAGDNFTLSGPTPSAASAIYHFAPVASDTASQTLDAPSFVTFPASAVARFGAYDRAINTPGVLDQYLQTDYNSLQTGPIDVSQYMPTVNGRTSFDYQREQIDAQAAAEQQRQLEQIDAALAAQGITGPAAVEAKNRMLQQLSLQRANAMQGVNQQQAAFMQDVAQQEAQNRFTRGERLGEQAFTGNITYAQLNQRERELTENARQIDNRLDFDTYAEANKYTNEERDRAWNAIQNDANRSLETGDLQLKIDDMRNNLGLQYQQLLSSTGVQRDQILANIHNNEQDIASAERQLAYRSWADQQLATLNSDLEQGRWEDQAAITQRQQSYFNMGKAGNILSDSQLQQLQAQDPLAYYAYLDGQAGLDQAVFDANLDIRTNYMNTAIGSLADLSGNDFISAMRDVFTQVNEQFGAGGMFAGLNLTGRNPPNPDNPDQESPPPPPPPRTPMAVTSFDQRPTLTPLPNVNPITGEEYPSGTGPRTHTYAAYTIDLGDGSTARMPMQTPGWMPQAPAGSTMLYRGHTEEQYAPGGAFVNGYQTATYQPQYVDGSTEATNYVDNIASVGPYAALQNQYTYDSATLRKALDNTLKVFPDLQPVAIGGLTDRPSPPDSGTTPPLQPVQGLALMMAAAGRPVALESGERIDGTGGAAVEPRMFGFQAPTADSYVPLDTAYLDQLSQSGDNSQLMSYAYTYANIGGYPYAIVPSYDPYTHDATGGVRAVSLNNPSIYLEWGA